MCKMKRLGSTEVDTVLVYEDCKPKNPTNENLIYISTIQGKPKWSYTLIGQQQRSLLMNLLSQELLRSSSLSSSNLDFEVNTGVLATMNSYVPARLIPTEFSC